MRRAGAVALAAALAAVLVGLAAFGAYTLYQSLVVGPQAPPTPAQPPTPTPEPLLTDTPVPLPPETSSGPIAPYPDAPLCADSGESHDNSLFHTLWDSARGCHYDHEHGEYPFTPEVEAAFPGFDLRALLGGVEVGHTNPSSPMENIHKHGGMKWQVTLPHPNGCAGHEGSPIGADASAIQYHTFGNYSIEFEARIHSALILMRQCTVATPTDYGYVYIVQHVDYGQRVSGYQGQIVPYPDNPAPAFDPSRAPYFTVDCIGAPAPPCGKFQTRQALLDASGNATTTWTSEPRHLVDSGSHLFELLFRARDTYQIFDWGDSTYPFTFVWLCSNDGGLTYAALPGCRYNNTTVTVHEINGTIPAEWDNLPGFDADPEAGRITAEGFVTRFGVLNTACAAPGVDCHPIKLVRAYVGYYGSLLIPDKAPAFGNDVLPEKDIYFCSGVLCAEGGPGAVPSGWIGPNN